MTLIDTKRFFELTFGALRGLVDPDFAPRLMWDHRSYLGDANLVLGRAEKVDPGVVTLVGGSRISYDFLVVATGSQYPSVGKNTSTTRASRIGYFRQQAAKIKAASSVLVVGGGPVGVEFAAELLDRYPGKQVSLIQHGEQLLPALDETCGDQAETFLAAKGCNLYFQDSVALDHHVDLLEGKRTLTTARGVALEVDLVFNAMGQT